MRKFEYGKVSNLVLAISEHSLECWIHPENAAIQIAHGDADRRRLEDSSPALIAGEQPRFRTLAIGDVDGHHGKECWSVFHRGYTRRADVRPNDRTVLASIALFKAIAGLLARYDAGEKPPRLVAIVLVRKFE